MSKPESIKIEPWTDFPRQSYSIITDDFCHEKLATVKVNAKGSRSTVNVKASANYDKGNYAISDEVKLWFQLPEGKSLYSRSSPATTLRSTMTTVAASGTRIGTFTPASTLKRTSTT